LTVVTPSASSMNGQLAEALAASISSRLYAGALEVTAIPSDTPTTESGLAVAVANATRAATRPVSLDLSALTVGTNHAVIGYYGSSIAVVFLFIGAGLGTRAIAMERTAGTLTRLAAAPVSSTAVVVAKMLAVLFTALVGLLVLWGETVLVFGASWGEPGAVLLMCGAATLSMCALAMFLTSLAKDESQAYAASIIVGILLGILGGNFFPPGSLPGVLQVISLGTPNGWALVGFGRLALVHAGVSGIVGPLLVLAGISVVFVAAASFRVKRVVEL
jgi:ABC-2 type transport system permease protein